MQPEFRLLYPAGCNMTTKKGMTDYGFIHSLQLDDMILFVKESFRGINDLSLDKFFTTDEEVLQYRLDVVEEVLLHPEVYEMFQQSLPLIYHINEMRRSFSSDFTTESALSSVRYLELYQEIVNLFYDGLRKIKFTSEGMKSFQTQIIELVKSEDYQNLNTELQKMSYNFGHIKSVTIGLNLNEQLQVKEAGIVSVNQQEFRPGNIMDRLLKNDKDSYALMSALYPLEKGLRREEYKVTNATMNVVLNTMFNRSLRHFEPLIQKYFNANTVSFLNLLEDIRFLVAGVGYIRGMQEKGFCMCKPEIYPMENKVCYMEDLYNPVLAGKTIEHTIVSNTFSFDENGRFYLVTGPNHGGKSIFAYSVGMAQGLFQLGLFVPAKCAKMSPVSGIFTHFPASDENNYGKGRLESECVRLSEIMKQLRSTDMLLMDESFSSTSGLEAGYIASEVLTGIGAIGCCGIYVTHIHDLTQQTDKFNSHPQNKGKIDNLVAQMENKENGTRSYKVIRTTPDGLSYARDIAKRHGLDLEQILKQKDKQEEL